MCVGMGGLSFGVEVMMWMFINLYLLVVVLVVILVLLFFYYVIGSIKGKVFCKGLYELWGLGLFGEML